MITLQKFYEMLEAHDWFFEFSDDHEVWRKGSDSLKELTRISAQSSIHTKMFEDYVDYMNNAVIDTPTKKPELKEYL